jgi:anti-anti-sigma regulatory factor
MRGEAMLQIHTDRVGDVAVVQCEGRLVRSDAAFRLRDEVISQVDARAIVLDLSEVNALEGGGLGMVMFLQRWGRDHDIQIKLFNPSAPVRSRLEQLEWIPEFEFASADAVSELLRRQHIQ